MIGIGWPVQWDYQKQMLIYNIEDQKDINLLGKIDAFLMTYQFPAFRSDEETTEFLVEALERACLPRIAAALKRDLKNALQREGIYVCMQPCVILQCLIA